jgi:hypothetical protein
MMAAARRTHALVQSMHARIAQIGKPQLPPSSSNALKGSQQQPYVDPYSNEITERIRQAREQMRRDAAADWQDIKTGIMGKKK